MNSKIAALGFAFALLYGSQVAAQWFGPRWLPNIDLTSQDRAMISATVKEKIHGRAVGTVARWINPASGHSGTIALLSKSEYRGMACERIEYRMKSPHMNEPPEQYVFRSCRLPDGSWKLAD